MLGKIIREARNKLGIAQYDLAVEIGKTTRSYISAIELGIELPSYQTLLALCNVLKLDYNEHLKMLKREKSRRYKKLMDNKSENKDKPKRIKIKKIRNIRKTKRKNDVCP